MSGIKFFYDFEDHNCLRCFYRKGYSENWGQPNQKFILSSEDSRRLLKDYQSLALS